MKRSVYVVALLFFAFVMVGQVMAQGAPVGYDKAAFQKSLDTAKEVRLSGTVVSHDPLCHCVVIKTAKGELTLLDDYAKFMQEYDQLPAGGDRAAGSSGGRSPGWPFLPQRERRASEPEPL